MLVGTEAVVRDIDTLSKIIEGEDARVNCELSASILILTYSSSAISSLGVLIRDRDRAIPHQNPFSRAYWQGHH